MLPGMSVHGSSGNVATVSIVDETVTDEQTFPQEATALYSLPSNGTGWLTGSTEGANYDARATVTAGSLTSGSDMTSSWLNLASTRSWYVTRSSNGIKACTFTLEIRPAGGGANLDSATITVAATVTP